MPILRYRADAAGAQRCLRNVGICGDENVGIIDVGGVAKLNVQVVFQAAVECGVGNARGAEFVCEGNAGTL